MRIKRIKAENFIRYQNLDIDFSKFDNVMGIVGKNGTGKTSLVEAISYSLFGEGRESGMKLLNRYSSSTEFNVEVTFDFEGKELIIRRGNGNKGAFGEVILDGETRVKNFSGITPFISQFLHITPKVFFSSVFCQQGGFNNFTNVDSPAERKKLLSDILDLEVYSLVEDRTNKAIKTLDMEMQSFSLMINQVKAELSQLRGENPENRRKEIEEQIKKIEAEETSINIAIDKLLKEREKFVTISSKKTAFDEMSSQLQFLKDEYKDLKEKRETVFNKLTNYQKEFLSITKELTELRETNKTLPVNSLNDVKNKIGILKGKLESLHARMKLLEADISICPTCLRPLENNLREKLLNTASNEKIGFEKELKDLKETETHLDLELSQEQEKIRQQNIKKETLKSDTYRLQQQINDLSENLKEIDISLNEKFKMIEEKSQKVKTLEKDIENIDTSSISEIEKQLSTLESTKISLQREKEGNISLLERMKIKEERLKELEKQLKDFENRLQNEYTKQMEVLKAVKYIFSRNGIPTSLMNEALDEVTLKSNFFLQRILPELSLRFDTLVETKQGTFKEGLWVFIEDSVGESSYALLSGGEKDLVDVSINLGISHLIRSRSKSLFDIIVLDEVFRHLDDINSEKLVELINSLKDDFSQIFVISHKPFVQGIFSSVLKTSRRGLYNQIEIAE